MKVLIKALTRLHANGRLSEVVNDRGYKKDPLTRTNCISLLVWDKNKGLMYFLTAFWKDSHPRWCGAQVPDVVTRMLNEKKIENKYIGNGCWETEYSEEELLTASNQSLREYAVRRLNESAVAS